MVLLMLCLFVCCGSALYCGFGFMSLFWLVFLGCLWILGVAGGWLGFGFWLCLIDLRFVGLFAMLVCWCYLLFGWLSGLALYWW